MAKVVPGFDKALPKQEADREIWSAFAKNPTQVGFGKDWSKGFEAVWSHRARPQLETKIKQLEAEIETLKKDKTAAKREQSANAKKIMPATAGFQEYSGEPKRGVVRQIRGLRKSIFG